jgi:beta-alanine--pyruvate transaminase
MMQKRPIPNDLAGFWMPFTANRQFKKAPRLLAGAQDMHYITDDGSPILDGTAGLWCVNAGRGRPKIVDAVQRQVAKLDYAPALPRLTSLLSRHRLSFPKRRSTNSLARSAMC